VAYWPIVVLLALSMEKLWIHRKEEREEQAKALGEELNSSALLGRLLLQRGISTFEEARTFFCPDLTQLHDPFLMKDMDKAVARLCKALEGKEKILVYGDYDVDGTTAVSLVFGFLEMQDARCDYYIPDRYEEGYGFSMKAVEWAAANGFSLIITLDCGIKDGERIARCNELGVDVIVCDHHQPSELPSATAVLDPKRPDCDYPYKGLSGCGVGFKLLQALCIVREINPEFLYQHLDLVAISIGADIVPLTGENRVLAYFGLKVVNDVENRRAGIKAMLDQAKTRKPQLTISDVVFMLAPRINAAGRIHSGRHAVALLLATNKEEADNLSAGLEEHNNTRKSLDKDITKEALSEVESDDFYRTSFATVVRKEGWHKGVIGIVASRLVEAYYKPTIVLTEVDGKLTGSARSIPGIDLYEVLGECAEHLIQFGGHTMAAGLTLKPEKFLDFRKAFDEEVAKRFNYEHPKPEIVYDSEISFADANQKFFNILKRFAPFGPENMKPIFRTSNVVNAGYTKPVGETQAHLKLHVKQHESSTAVNGIAFDQGAWSDFLKENGAVDLLYTLEENEWNNQVSIQLNVVDIRKHVTEDAVVH
jgi:single-stranded-DNA-specific exonuclease